jgi:fibronectin type 3 domain-containing protein
LGQNEIGKTSAENIIYALGYATRPTNKAEKVSVVGVNGYTAVQSKIYMGYGDSCHLIVRVKPAYLMKKISVTTGKGLSWGISGLKSNLKSGSSKVTISAAGITKSINVSYETAAPTVTGTVTNKGIALNWTSISGAKKYYIYRRHIDSAKWQLLTTTTALSYTDSSAKIHETYYYTVRAIKKDGSESAYELDGLKIRYASTNFNNIVLSNVKSGVYMKWDKTDGATGYYIYRRTSGNSFVRIANVKASSGCSYTDKNVKSGTVYAYTIRAYNDNSMYSYDTTGVGIYVVRPPEITTIKNVANGVSIKWNKVSGAQGYYIYRKTGTGTWKKIAVVGGSISGYIDKNTVKGKTYTYAVRAYHGSIFSSLDKTGKHITYQPTFYGILK